MRRMADGTAGVALLLLLAGDRVMAGAALALALGAGAWLGSLG